MALRRRATLALSAAAVLAWPAPSMAQGTPLAPLGVLRAVWHAGNPIQAVRDPASGAVHGIAHDLTRELARRADIRFTFESRPGVVPVIDAVRHGAADIGFLANDPSRHDPVLFSHAYLRNPQSLAVPAGSRLHSLAEHDRAGLRIGAGHAEPAGLHLARTLTAATFIPLDTVAPAAIARLFAEGTLDAFAASRLRLRQLAALVPGLRILPGSLFGVPQAIIVPKGAATRLAQVDAFLRAVRHDGFLQAAIDRSDTEAEIEP